MTRLQSILQTPNNEWRVGLLRNPMWALYAVIWIVFLASVRGPTPLAQAIDMLRGTEAKVIGVVLNKVHK